MIIYPRVACCLSALVIAAVAPFDIHFIRAGAVDSNMVQLTPGLTRALFGDEILGSRWDENSNDYVSCTFSYLGTTNVGDYRMRSSYGDAMDRICPRGSYLLIYQSDFQGVLPDFDYDYYTVRLNPVINLGMLNRISFVAGMSKTAIQVPDDENDPDGDWHWGFVYEAKSVEKQNYWSCLQNGNYVRNDSVDMWTTNSNIYDWLSWGVCGTSQSNTRFFVPNIIDLSSDSYFSFTDFQITRQGNCKATQSQSSRCLLYISCPILSDDYQDLNGEGQTGTDLTATNTKLDTIISILSLIARNTSNVPDSDPGNTDIDVDLDFDLFNDTMDDINDDLDFLDQFSDGIDDYEFQEAEYTQMYSDVHDLISLDAGDRQLVPGSGALPDSMQMIRNEISGQDNIIYIMMTMTAAIALISYVIFGKR